MPEAATPLSNLLGTHHPWPWRIVSSRYLFLVFLTVVLLTGDVVSFRVAGMTVRLVVVGLAIMLMIQYIYLRDKLLLDPQLVTRFFLLCLAVSFSMINTIAPLQSIGYIAWIYATVFLVMTPLYNQALWSKSEDSFGIWLLAFRIMGALLILEALFFPRGLDPRPHLLFYETSYAAMFFNMYFAASLYLALDYAHRYWWDVLFSLLVIVALASATAILGVLICLLLVIPFSKRKMLLLLCVVPTFLGGLIIAYLQLEGTHLGYLMFGFLEAGIEDPEKFLGALMGRSGNRGLLVMIGIDLFSQHPLYGIGIGSGNAWNTQMPIPDYVKPFLFETVGIRSNPFASIPVEVLAETGLLGFTGFLVIIAYAVHRTRRLKLPKTPEGFYAKATLIAFLAGGILLCGSSNFLRFYWWSVLALGLGLATRYESQQPEHSSGRLIP